jgi:hypothetical protein
MSIIILNERRHHQNDVLWL